MAKGLSVFFIRKSIAEQLDSWRNPINKNSAAMRDGRSKPPPLPDFLIDENAVRTVNAMLNTTRYDMDALDEMPELWIEKIILWARAAQAIETPHGEHT